MVDHLKASIFPSHEAEGQGLVEYALIILLVAIAVVGSLTTFGAALTATISDVAAQI